MKGKETQSILDRSLKRTKAFRANSSDDYYFIMENTSKDSKMNADISFFIEALNFDTSKAKGFYDGSFRMDFPFGSQHFLVLYNPSKTSSYSISLQFFSRAHVLFIVLFIMEAFGFCLFLLKRPNSNSHGMNYSAHFDVERATSKLT